MEGGNRMKKRAIIVLCLALVLTLIGCGNNAQSSDEHMIRTTKKVIPLATRMGIMMESNK